MTGGNPNFNDRLFLSERASESILETLLCEKEGDNLHITIAMQLNQKFLFSTSPNLLSIALLLSSSLKTATNIFRSWFCFSFQIFELV